jgi:hypothetical protein
MLQNFQVIGIDGLKLEPLFAMSDARLAEKGMVRMIVDSKPGFPCRISLEDAEIGEEVLLLPYVHHNSGSPYRASGPIFIRRKARAASLEVNEIPEMLVHRLLSVKAYDTAGMMQHALVLNGSELQRAIHELFANTHIAYLQIHNAGPGCYNCQVNRIG